MATEIVPPEPDLATIQKRLRRGPIWRLFGWGSTACLALAAVALTSQTEAGSKRLRLALGFSGEPASVVAALPPGMDANDAETRRLAAQVRDLTADRERLNARIALLEHHLEDMTGSIKQQGEQIAAARAASPPPAPSVPETIVVPPLAPAELPFFMSMRMPQAAEPPQPPQQAEGEPVPLPPVRVATTAVNEPASAKGEFAIDLGGAASIEALRAHWATLKTNYGPLLAGLRPLVTQHPRQPSGVTYRLVAGPLANAEDAARLCARFPALRTGCHATRFSGAQLAAP